MTDLRKAAEMALEALEMLDRRGGLGLDVHEYIRTKIEALRQALAQEWVCCVCGDPNALGIVHSADAPCFHYTKREWVGLTDADKQEAFDETQEAGGGFWEFADYLDAKLKEKNTC